MSGRAFAPRKFKTKTRVPRPGGPAFGSFLPYFVLCMLSFVICIPPSVHASVDIKSKAAVVMDSTTGRVLYAKNPDLKLLPASTTKLMTALVVMEHAKLSDVVTISKKVANTPAIRVGLHEGDKVTVEDLLYAALMKSANDAAVALAEGVAGSEENFVKLMNRKAVAIGANDTRYINANGLPGDGQYITAYDLAKIMRQAIKYPVLKEILGTRITEVSTQTGKQMIVRNTNKLLWSDDEVLGGKTGFTRQARHCFVCAGERDKDTIIVALLGAPYRGLLWTESEELMTFGAKVMNKSEEPVLYLTKNDRNDYRAAKVSYAVESTTSVKKIRHHKKRHHGRIKVIVADSSGKKTKKIAKKKKNVHYAGSIKKKRIQLAKKNKKHRRAEIALKDNGIKG